MAPRKPVEFIVGRHLITHPEDGVMDIVRHTYPEGRPELALDKGSVSRARHKLLKATGGDPALLVDMIDKHPERPRHKAVHLAVADPVRVHERWHAKISFKHWWSGELAAAEVDQLPVMPGKILVYVRPKDIQEAAQFTVDEFYGQFTDPARANYVIRAKDPWMYSDEAERGGYYVEQGQRMLDYRDSRNIHLMWAYRS